MNWDVASGGGLRLNGAMAPMELGGVSVWVSDSAPRGTVLLTPAPAGPNSGAYTIEGLIKMRNFAWNGRNLEVAIRVEEPPAELPSGRFRNLDWEEVA